MDWIATATCAVTGVEKSRELVEWVVRVMRPCSRRCGNDKIIRIGWTGLSWIGLAMTGVGKSRELVAVGGNDYETLFPPSRE